MSLTGIETGIDVGHLQAPWLAESGAVVGNYIIAFANRSFWDTGTQPPISTGRCVIVHRPSMTARIFTGTSFNPQLYGSAVGTDGRVYLVRSSSGLVGSPKMQSFDPVTGVRYESAIAGSGTGIAALPVGNNIWSLQTSGGTSFYIFNPVADTRTVVTTTPWRTWGYASYGGSLYLTDIDVGVRRYNSAGVVVNEWLFPSPRYYGTPVGPGFFINGKLWWGNGALDWFGFDPASGAMTAVAGTPPLGGVVQLGMRVQLGNYIYQRGYVSGAANQYTKMFVWDPQTGLYGERDFPGSANHIDNSTNYNPANGPLKYGVGTWFCAADNKLWFPSSEPVPWSGTWP